MDDNFVIRVGFAIRHSKPKPSSKSFNILPPLLFVSSLLRLRCPHENWRLILHLGPHEKWITLAFLCGENIFRDVRLQKKLWNCCQRRLKEGNQLGGILSINPNSWYSISECAMILSAVSEYTEYECWAKTFVAVRQRPVRQETTVARASSARRASMPSMAKSMLRIGGCARFCFYNNLFLWIKCGEGPLGQCSRLRVSLL